MKFNNGNLAKSGMAGLVLFAAGCATTAPTAKFSSHSTQRMVVHAGDLTSLDVTTAPHVVIADDEKSRLISRIRANLEEKKTLNPAQTDPMQYQVDVLLTRYEKGSKAARLFLAGLGQMHIDGNVKVYVMPAHTLVSDFVVEKTFAWGGVYGATTSMEDIEDSFAVGIANACAGQGDAEKGDGKR